MCGRYTLTRIENLLNYFPWVKDIPSANPRYNIAPTQPVLALANNRPDRFEFFHWGLIPSWAKDKSIGSRMINARAETLAGKPAFRTALRKRRCLVPADGFYEWRKEADGKTKTPMYIRLRDTKPFAFAGLWEVWRSPDGTSVPSCTLITTTANNLVEGIHDRMPVIIPPEAYERWLDPKERDLSELRDLLKPYPAEEMEAFPVAKTVNSPANETDECVKPAREQAAGPRAPKEQTLFDEGG
jgi:putative SOS response-associated peptidase YedK